MVKETSGPFRSSTARLRFQMTTSTSRLSGTMRTRQTSLTSTTGMTGLRLLKGRKGYALLDWATALERGGLDESISGEGWTVDHGDGRSLSCASGHHQDNLWSHRSFV